MKKLLFLIPCFFIYTLQAQDLPKSEAVLAKAYSRLEQLSNKNNWDELTKANDEFTVKLKTVLSNPRSIEYPFKQLIKAHVEIFTSDDGLFRIYTWDTWTGGTMHIFKNIYQYKTPEGATVIEENPKVEGSVDGDYNGIYTFKNGTNVYYLAVTYFIEWSSFYAGGIQVFAIENGKLNKNVKLIKTKSGLHSNLSYEYNWGSYKNTAPIFNATEKTIQIPLVNSKNNITGRYITYKFTGKYFEQVKN